MACKRASRSDEGRVLSGGVLAVTVGHDEADGLDDAGDDDRGTDNGDNNHGWDLSLFSKESLLIEQSSRKQS